MGGVFRDDGMNKCPYLLSQKKAMAWTQMTLSALTTLPERERVEFGEGDFREETSEHA